LENSRIPKKRGQLSLDEEAYIRENVNLLSIDAIASNLNRHEGPIKRYINENNLLIDPEDKAAYETLKDKLHSKTFWVEITRQFDADSGELQYFEDTWVGLIKQFREDVLPAEELQIKQFITIDILINRSMKERKRHISETEKLQKLVDKEYEKSEDQRDIPKLANLETQLSFARNSIANYTNEYTKLLNEQQKISKDLKATREQRIKRIEGKEMEILGMAAIGAKERMQQYHTYQDDTVDVPLLTPEFMENHNE
jgi:IS30 family transposase